MVLDVSNPPTGELVLWQVETEAAQLENCELGFWSLWKKEKYIRLFLNTTLCSKYEGITRCIVIRNSPILKFWPILISQTISLCYCKLPINKPF